MSIMTEASPATLVETVACNLCGREDACEFYAANTALTPDRPGRLRCTDEALGQHGRIVRCPGCGLVYASPRSPQAAILEAYGQVEDQTYVAESQGRVLTFDHALDVLERYHPVRGRLLDVGCYTGLFLQRAAARGWSIEGLELSRWASAMARAHCGCPVYQGDLRNAPWAPASFDVVTVWDVLEHVLDPLGDLQRIQTLLVPGGHVALTTVDIGSLSARLMGTRWWWLMEMHLYYFTRDTLDRMLWQAGFEVVTMRPHVRVISLGYLWSRLTPYWPWAAKVLERCGQQLRINERPLSIYGAGLITVIARKSGG